LERKKYEFGRCKHNQPPSWELIIEMLEAAKIYE
jgi:hypothetical protein